jgi:hypothetical protein
VPPALAVLTACAIAGIAPLAAQRQSDAQIEGRRLVEQAMRLAERGDTAAAVDQAARAARVAPDLADARFLYGLLLARTSGAGFGSWGRRIDADREFEAALRLDADNPRYLIEIARLRLKQPLLRVQAERLFRRALASAHRSGDPLAVAEVESDIGHIYLRRYQAVAHRRVIIGQSRTFEWEAALRDPHYTRDILLEYSAAGPRGDGPGEGRDPLPRGGRRRPGLVGRQPGPARPAGGNRPARGAARRSPPLRPDRPRRRRCAALPRDGTVARRARGRRGYGLRAGARRPAPRRSRPPRGPGADPARGGRRAVP